MSHNPARPGWPADPAGSGDPFDRARFYPGMLVGAEDLVVDQRATLLRHRLHQALFHPRGRLLGLGVSAATQDGEATGVSKLSCLRVEAGLAIDALGREIFVHRRQLLDVSRLHTLAAFWGAGRSEAWVVLSHEATPYAPTAGATGDDPSRAGRIRDGFALELMSSRPTTVDLISRFYDDPAAIWEAASPIALARVSLSLESEELRVGQITPLGAPRLLHCSIEGGTLVAHLDAPVLHSTVNLDSVELWRLEGGGWQQVQTATITPDGARIRIANAGGAPNALLRLRLVGTGPRPILGLDELPLAGSADDPGGPAGKDAIAMARWPGGS